MMDAYGPSPAARRYASPQVVNRIKMSTGSTLGNLGVMGGGGGGKLTGNSKPRASSASLTRRSNSPAAGLANSGNFSFQTYQRSSFDGELDGGAKGNAYGSYGGPYQQAHGGVGGGGGSFVSDSYDQLRRNYELSHNGAVNATTLLGAANGALVPRAQSASQFRSNGGNSGTSFANSGQAGNSAYLSLRQQQSAALGYGSGGGTGDGASLLDGGINGLFPPSSMRGGGGGGGGLNRLGVNNTRGIASGGNFNYGANAAGGGLLGLSVAEAQRMVANSSTEIIPANYVLKPILAPRNNVTSVPKGTAGQGTGRRVTFSTPLTSYTPLANPFMFQTAVAVLPPQGQQQGQPPPQQQQTGSSLSPTSTGTTAASLPNPIRGGTQHSQGPGTNSPLSSNGAYGSLPDMGAANNTPALLRPASATAVLSNSNSNSGSLNPNINNSQNTNSYNTSNATGGAVLTHGTAVNTSRSSSPVTVGSPIPGGGFFNASAGASGTTVNTSTSSSGSAGIIGLGIASAGKPPLFVSTATGSATPYLDAATSGLQLSPVPNSGASTPSSSGSSASGGGGGGTIARPVPVPANRAQQRPSSADIHLGGSVTAIPTPAVLAPLLAFVAPGSGAEGGMIAPSPRTAAAAAGGALPLIRTQSPSLPPTASNTNSAGSGSNPSTINVNSSYTPLFNQVPSPGRPPSGPGRGMVLSNSTENLATIAQAKEDHGANTTLLKSALQGKAQRPGSANIALASTSADSASVGSASSSVASSSGGGGSLPRKGSMDSLADMTFTRMTAPVRTASTTKALSPRGAATTGGAWGELRRDSNASSVEEGSLTDPTRGSSRSGRSGRRTPQRPSLAEQLAHISAESNVPSAKTTDELAKSASQDSHPSFFSQSLNSAIAIGRGASTSNGGSGYTSPVPTDFNDGRTTPEIMAQPTVPPSPSNTLYALPAKVFSIGSQSCRQPSRVCFYCDRAEYTFYPPTPSDSAALSMALYYTDMSAISTVGTKLRFKVSARAVQELVDDAALNSLLLVSVELTSSASMAIVRDRVIPLINQAKS